MVLYRIAVAILALVLGLGANREILEGAGSDKLNVGWGSISGTQAGLWVAKEKGLFEKQGLDVTLIYIPGGPRPVMAMLGGTIQLLSFSSLPSFEAYLKGADTVIIGSTLNHLEHFMVVHPSIRQVEDLRGKTIGIGSLGSLTDVALREALRLNNLSERDVTVLPAGDLTARLVGLRTGTIHGTLLVPFQATAAVKMGFKKLIDFSKLPIEVSVGSILSTRAYVLRNQDSILRFLKAWTEGIYIFKSNREAGFYVMKKYARIDDPEDLETLYAYYQNLISTKPFPSVATVKSMLQILTRLRPTPQERNPEVFVEARFMSELERAGFFDEMSRQYPTAKN